MTKPKINLTDFGFVWGGAIVQRICSFPKGHVVIEVKSKRKNRVEIYVTPGGLIRVYRYRGKRLLKSNE